MRDFILICQLLAVLRLYIIILSSPSWDMQGSIARGLYLSSRRLGNARILRLCLLSLDDCLYLTGGWLVSFGDQQGRIDRRRSMGFLEM